MRETGTVRKVAILGSTGSIGTQAVEVCLNNPDLFRVTALAAGGSNLRLLAEQAVTLAPDAVAVPDPDLAGPLSDAMLAVRAERRSGAEETNQPGTNRPDRPLPTVMVGPEAVAELAALPADVVLNAVDGSRGLAVTLSALHAGHTVALANKESLVAGGPLIHETLRARGGTLVPVDSEHAALAQCMRAGHTESEVRRAILTASGGPFRGRRRDELKDVTPEAALRHPNWSMGRVNTINSATLVNKGLEVIEGHEMFGIDYERFEVVVQPRSVVHAMVEFIDGSTVLQASPPDMKLPIAHALAWPDRVPRAAVSCDWSEPVSWDFEPVDHETFPGIRLAIEAGTTGGTAPAVYNAANEVCVQAFCDHRLPFLGIVDTVARVVADHVPGNVMTADDVAQAEHWARVRAAELIEGS